MRRVGIAFLFVALVALVGCTGAEGEPGEQGPIGATGATGPSGQVGATGATGTFDAPASISGVNPDAVFVGRDAWITISGFNTTWADDADTALNVMFCDGVTYDRANLVVASPTAIVVPISVSPAALLGPCEVKVGANGETLTYANGFALKSPLLPLAYAGDFKQGSIAVVQIQNLDFENPFDATTDDNGFFTNVTFAPSSGIGYIALDVQPYSMIVEVLMDVDVAAGKKSFGFASGPAGGQVGFALEGAFDITARTPVALIAGTPQTTTVSDTMASQLFVYTPSAGDKHATFTAASAAAQADPRFALLPANGKFADMLDFTSGLTWWTAGNAAYYLVSLDWSGATGTSYTVRADNDNETSNATCANALALTPPTVVHGLILDSDSDVDWFKVTTGTNIGTDKYLRVVTTDVLGAFPDTAIEIYDGCGEGDPTGPLAESDSTSMEYWLDALIYGAPLTSETTYYIKVLKGTGADPGAKLGAYNLEVTIDTVPATACDETAIPLTLPYSSTTPFTLTADDAVNWYKISIASTDLNKVLTVVTKPGDLHTDTAIAIYGGTCGTALAASDDSDFFDRLAWVPLVEGTYYIAVRAGLYAYDDSDSSALSAGSRYDLDVFVQPAAETANDSCAAPQTVSLPFAPTIPLSFSSDTDEDWFKFTAAAADIGKRVRVMTSVAGLGSNMDTDTMVSVYAGSSCTTLNTLGEYDSYSQVDLLAPTPIYQAGDVYVRVMPGYFGTVFGSLYYLSITLE